MSSMMRRSRELLEVARNFRAAPRTTESAIFNYLSSLGTPRALAVWLLYKHGEHDQLVALQCSPRDYGRMPYAFRLDYCATEFLSKAKFLRTTFDKKQVAIQKFLEYEDLCKSTNARFRNLSLDPKYHGSNVWLLNATSRIISQVLGEFSADEFVDGANWGPGVSTLIKGEEVSAFNKFHSESGITRDLYDFIRPWIQQAYPLWNSHRALATEASWSFQIGNEVTAVAKNSKTDRIIAIEPGLNIWFQKSIGAMIRNRLLRSKIDLNSQKRNQQLARIGSLDSALATVDFSSASDSISKGLVRELLPPDWFSLMDVCRSKLGTIEGRQFRWEKFSSMGNGFTFELESLIFYAAARATLEFRNKTRSSGTPELGMETISVYGDDVIIPSDCFDLYSSFCDFLGFRVNPKKSFSSGHFRESCGCHFFDGISVKPIFLKEKLCYVESFFKLANNVRRLAHRYGNYRSCDVRFESCWSYLLGRVPEPLRLFVPLSGGDTGFIGNFDEATPSRARFGVEGHFYRALSTSPIRKDTEDPHLILARIWELPVRPLDLYPSRIGWCDYRVDGRDLSYGNNYSLRGRTKRAITSPLVRQWYNLGAWE